MTDHHRIRRRFRRPDAVRRPCRGRRRRVYLAALVGFAAASRLGALAEDPSLLTATRGGEGLWRGAALPPPDLPSSRRPSPRAAAEPGPLRLRCRNIHGRLLGPATGFSWRWRPRAVLALFVLGLRLSGGGGGEREMGAATGHHGRDRSAGRPAPLVGDWTGWAHPGHHGRGPGGPAARHHDRDWGRPAARPPGRQPSGPPTPPTPPASRARRAGRRCLGHTRAWWADLHLTGCGLGRQACSPSSWRVHPPTSL
ncbi:hypothetical protein SMICM304S_08071 [Streptomyces microflavus]